MTPHPEVHTMKMVCMWYSNKYSMLYSTLIWMTSQLIKCIQFILEYNQLLFVATYEKGLKALTLSYYKQSMKSSMLIHQKGQK